MTNEIFISLTQDDTGIAEALASSIKELFDDKINVCYYTSNELDGGIRHGENWFSWILERVKKCDFAFVIMTPSSFQKPWILWEAGVIYGAAMATGKDVLRPIVYQLRDDQIPLPISHVQYKRGDQAKTVKVVFKEIFEQYKDTLKTERFADRYSKIDSVIESYLKQVNSSLLMSPLIKMANQYLEINIQDWKERTKKKNDVAVELGTYVITNRLPKEKLTNEDNEGLLLALAEAIYIRPEINDIDLLIKVESKVTRWHVKFRILRSIDQLIEKHCIIRDKIPAINQILKSYAFDADDYLLKKIDLVGSATTLL
jgi:hypothetical protein